MIKKEHDNEFAKAKNILETNYNILLKHQKNEVDKDTIINELIRQKEAAVLIIDNIEQKLNEEFLLAENKLTQAWWEELSDEWKELLLFNIDYTKRLIETNNEYNSFIGTHESLYEDLGGHTYISQTYNDIPFIISELQKLKHLYIFNLKDNKEIEDISPLLSITNLESIELELLDSADISTLTILTQLKKLKISVANIDDFKVLTKLHNLKSLTICSDKLVNLIFLSQLINLEELKLQTPNNSNYKVLPKLNKLKSLTIFSSKIDNLIFLNQLINLEELSLQTPRVSNYYPLVLLKKLKKLGVSGAIMDELPKLDSLVVLEELYLSNTPTNDFSDISNIQDFRNSFNLEKLKKLTIIDDSLYSLIFIAELSGLIELKISIKEVDIKHLSRLTNLKSLTLKQNSDYDGDITEDYSELENLQKLEFLEIDNHGIDDISALARLKRLNSLKIIKNYADLTPLSSLKNLTKLVLEDNRADLASISNLVNLTDLEITSSIWELKPLDNLINLREINISNHGISDLTPFSKLINLQKINISENSISDLTPFSKLINLQEINITGTCVTDLSPLSNLINLRVLKIDNSGVDLSPISHLSNIQIIRYSSNHEPAPDIDTGNLNTAWWNNLSELWKDEMLFNIKLKPNPNDTTTYISSESDIDTNKIKKQVINDIELTVYTIQEMLDMLFRIRAFELIHTSQIDDLLPLVVLTNLRVLNLSDYNNDISPIMFLINLEELDLSCFYTEKHDIWNSGPDHLKMDLSPLINLRNLRKLDLKGWSLPGIYFDRDTYLNPLKGLTKLTHLALSYNSCNLSPITNLVQLKELMLSYNKADLTPISNLVNLTKLNLFDNRDNDLTPLTKLKNLSELNLGGFFYANYDEYDEVGDTPKYLYNFRNTAKLDPIGKLLNLKTLNLPFNTADLSPLKNLTKITTLNLNGNTAELSPLSNLVQLKKLDIRANINDLSPLENLVQLTELNLGVADTFENNEKGKPETEYIINNGDLDPLWKLKNLKILNLEGNTKNLYPISKPTNLEVLDLSLSTEDLSPIRSLVNLSDLSLKAVWCDNISKIDELLKTIKSKGGVVNEGGW